MDILVITTPKNTIIKSKPITEEECQAWLNKNIFKLGNLICCRHKGSWVLLPGRTKKICLNGCKIKLE